MSITVNCSCGKSFDVPDDYAGKAGKCKACGRTISVPSVAPHMAAAQTHSAKASPWPDVAPAEFETVSRQDYRASRAPRRWPSISWARICLRFVIGFCLLYFFTTPMRMDRDREGSPLVQVSGVMTNCATAICFTVAMAGLACSRPRLVDAAQSV